MSRAAKIKGSADSGQDRLLSIGENIRRFRTSSAMTLKQLSDRSGVSIATISKIETGKVSGGFETIYKIARGLGVLVTDIMNVGAGSEQSFVVHAKNSADVHATDIYDYFPQAFLSVGALNPYMMLIHTRVVPDRIDWSIHEGEEFVCVVSGAIDLHYEGRPPQRLEEGDSVCFNSGTPHAFVSVSRRPAKIFSVSTRGPRSRRRGGA